MDRATPKLEVLAAPQKPPLTRADAQADMIACGIKPRERILHQPQPPLTMTTQLLPFGAIAVDGVVRITEWHPTYRTIDRILAEYFEIDRDRLDDEKRAMLNEIRATNR
jgi:hypothetical protein